jgi:hypothetical protein
VGLVATNTSGSSAAGTGYPVGGTFLDDEAKDTYTYKAGHLLASGVVASQPTIFVYAWGFPPGAQYKLEFVHHVEYVPSSAVAGLVQTAIAPPAPGAVMDAVTRVAAASSRIGGSTTLAAVNRVVDAAVGISQKYLPATSGGGGSSMWDVARGMAHVVGRGAHFLTTHGDKFAHLAELLGSMV